MDSRTQYQRDRHSHAPHRIACSTTTAATGAAATPTSSASTKIKSFDEESLEYYPPACCELLHITNAVYLATILQIVAVVTLAALYYTLERNSFLTALEIFRPAVGFIICVNVVGILCALTGVLLQRDALISAQITLLIGLVVVSDVVAFSMVAVMAFGSKLANSRLRDGLATGGPIPSYFVDERRFEAILGPFWIYLIAILFHMCAASLMCIIGIQRRYCKFLKDKFTYNRIHPHNSMANDAAADDSIDMPSHCTITPATEEVQQGGDKATEASKRAFINADKDEDHGDARVLAESKNRNRDDQRPIRARGTVRFM